MNKKSPMLLVVLDGVGDLKNPNLNNRTPLEAATIPNINNLASSCNGGLIYPIKKDIAPESDAAIMSLLGYDLEKEYTGRGPLESFGAGLAIKGSTLALRCNFATINDKRVILDRRAGRNVTQAEAKALEKEINNIKINGVKFRFKATVGHRGVLVIYQTNKKLSSEISNADISYTRSGSISIASSSESNDLPRVCPLDKRKESAYTADIINMIIGAIIKKLKNSKTNKIRVKAGKMPANVLLMRDAGLGLPKTKRFYQKYGLKSAFAAEMPIERGIAKLAEMTELRLKTNMTNREKYAKMAQIVKNNYKKFDFIYVHIKGPDEPGHDGNAPLKKKIIEEIDSTFFKKILPFANKMLICITGDHSTPCILKSHSGDPVPLMIKSADPKKNKDKVKFSESGVKRGTLGYIYGRQLIKILLKYR